MKSIKLVAAAVSFSILASSCGSIINGSSQDIPIRTTPKDVTILIKSDSQTVYNKQVTTPIELELDRSEGFFEKANYQVTISAPGYEPMNFNIKGKVSGWYIAGNIFLGGLIGWLIVDPATGGMWKLTPEEINATLGNDQSFFQLDAQGLNIILKQDMPEGMFEKFTKD